MGDTSVKALSTPATNLTGASLVLRTGRKMLAALSSFEPGRGVAVDDVGAALAVSAVGRDDRAHTAITIRRFALHVVCGGNAPGKTPDQQWRHRFCELGFHDATVANRDGRQSAEVSIVHRRSPAVLCPQRMSSRKLTVRQLPPLRANLFAKIDGPL